MASIAQHLKDVMIETGAEIAWAGDPDLLLTAYARSGGIEADGYIRACDCSGTREILHPAFKIAS